MPSGRHCVPRHKARIGFAARARDGGRSFQFRLGEGRVIKGWEVGIAGMRVGGLRRLVIPPELAYGDQSPPGSSIPPGSTLVFEVELLGIEE